MSKLCVMKSCNYHEGVQPGTPTVYLLSYNWTDDGATYEITENKAHALRLSEYEAFHLERGELHDLLVVAHCHHDPRWVWWFIQES